jgi:hypothetical protein
MNARETEILATARAASDVNARRAKEATDALYNLMLFLDLLPDEETPAELHDCPEWKAGARVLGWDVDWAAVAEGRA